ncbi:hypothetical protein FJM01_02215 [Mycoplasma struthionis]|uniref:Lipoprotein n=2 Tax=Mycoplasma struthionis TaxID=538220 RepID=A0A502MII3_9MOLU|nr:hypothetical protein FJM01_02215 [Mycoplasma struthionis]
MMEKKNVLKLLFSLSTSAIAGSFLVSCQQINQQKSFIDINKISRRYLNRLSLNQIASLHNYQKIFYYYDSNNKKQYYDEAKIKNNKLILIAPNREYEYKIDFPIRSQWVQSISEFNNVNILDGLKKADVNDFFNSYTFDEVDSANGFNDEWFSVLNEKFKHDFTRVGDPYFADIQTIIFRIFSDIASNYSLMNDRFMVNKDNKKVLYNNIFQPQFIQAESWISKDHIEQRKIFESLLALYLNKFNVDIKSVEIDWDNLKILHSFSGASDYVAFKFKDIKNWDNQSILSNENKEKTFYINGFRTYKTAQKFGVGLEGLKEKLPLFNDYIPNPLLYINGGNILNIVDNINYFVKSATSIDFWNTKGLMYLFQNFKDKFFYIDVPDYKKDEDKEYKIIDFHYTDYLKTNQLLVATVRVIKKDNSFKDYSLISSNFDDHGHRLKGMILKNKKPQYLLVSDIYSYKVPNDPLPSGISLDDFISLNKESAFMILLKVAFEKLQNNFGYWNNDYRANFEASKLNSDSFQIKLLGAYINNYLLAYELENKANEIRSGVKRIDLEVIKDDQNIGQLKLKLKFMGYKDNNDFNFINKEDPLIKEITVLWNGFKGSDTNFEPFEVIK